MVEKTLNNETLLELMSIAAAEERFYVEAHQKRIQFFIVLISTLFGSIILAITRAKEIDIAPLLLGPVLVLVSAQFGKVGVKSLYIRLLETIAVRAKLEQALGLSQSVVDLKGEQYWPKEPLINTRHLLRRSQFSSSEEFINHHSSLGYQKTVERLFLLFQICALLLGIAISVISPFVSSFTKSLASFLVT